MPPFEYHRIPSFAEGDPAGLIHFSRLACYVEEAEHTFLARAGFPVDLQADPAIHWPRVSFSAEYLAPATPLQKITVRLTHAEAGRTSITWTWEIHHDRHPLARGTMKTVCLMQAGNTPTPSPLPDDLRRQLPQSQPSPHH